MPLAVRLQRGKHRLVDLDKGGAIALGANGKPIDGGGESTEAGRRKLIKQAQAVNLSQQEKKQRMVEAMHLMRRRKKKKPKRGRMKEEAMTTTLPVLDLAGVDYGLSEMAAGRPGLLVVEDPKGIAGKSFRFAEGDGFRAISLGTASGPFHSIMALPPRTIRGLDSTRLRELRDARALYLVPIAEATKLQEEGEDEPEGGMHWHEVDREAGLTLEGEMAWHRHVFFIEEELELEDGFTIPAGSLIFTERDGDHPHEVDDEGNATDEGGEHDHKLVVMNPEGEVILEVTTSKNGKHAHQLMVQRTGLDGLHVHQLTIAGRTLTSLTPAEFAELELDEPESTEE